MDSLKQSTKKRFNRLRKAVSLERLDKSSEDTGGKSSPSLAKRGGMPKSPSLRSLTDALGSFRSGRKRDKKTAASGSADQTGSDVLSPEQRKPPRAPASLSKKTGAAFIQDGEVDNPRHFRPIGKLKALNKDGTRVIEMMKPPHGPYGFFIAQGNAKFNHGVFVSRLSDALPEHFMVGLLSIGDEILEINGQSVRDMTLDDADDLMAQHNTLILKTLPFAARKET